MASDPPKHEKVFIHRHFEEPEVGKSTGEFPKLGTWQAIRRVGEGGQGIVYLAFDSGTLSGALADPKEWLLEFGRETRWEQGRISMDALAAAFANLLAPDSFRYGALKVLRNDEGAKDLESAQHRFIRELETHGILDHRGLLQTLDSSLKEGWLVSELHAKGSLDKHPFLFKGRPLEALHAMRQVVEGVATMHDANRVHRDIKPQNLFVADGDRLVLGDFGIVHVIDEDGTQQTRFSHPFEKVGTLAWMPPWAIPFLPEPKPNFDVFALGKVLWAMVTGEHNLRNIYDNGPLISAVCDGSNESLLLEDIVKKCVVEKESECEFENAGELLAAIGEALESHRCPLPIQVALHAFSRPGPPYLVSIDPPLDEINPVVHPKTSLWLVHDENRGEPLSYPPGTQFPQEHIEYLNGWEDI